MRVRMIDAQGKVYHWTIRRVFEAFNVGLLQKARKVTGWEFTSHDGCTRFSEGNWHNLVGMFNSVAENYGMTCNVS